MALAALDVAGSNIGAAEHQQIFQILARLKEQTAIRRVRAFLFGERNGPQVQARQLLHVFQPIIWQPQAVENSGQHSRADVFVAVK